MLKVGIVGVGGMGSNHAARYSQMDDVQIAGVYDHDDQTAERIVRQFGATKYGNVDQLIRAVDYVDICTPTNTHVDLLEQVANAGKSVFTEKPLGRTLEECKRAVEAVRKNNVLCMPGHVVRFCPEFKRAKEMVGDGAVGTPAAIRTTRARVPMGGWNADTSMRGGVILDLIVHDFDWIRWTFGPVERVFARGIAANKPGGFDYALVTLKLKNGAIAHVEGSWAEPSNFFVAFEIAGDKGLLDYNSNRDSSFKVTKAKTETTTGFSLFESPLTPQEDPLYLELRHFADCVIAGKEPDITVEDGYEAARIALAALESAKTGQPVDLTVGGVI
ncbi:MAG: Gfo/Idh/MocA family oxidoreductase [bacterium]